MSHVSAEHVAALGTQAGTPMLPSQGDGHPSGGVALSDSSSDAAEQLRSYYREQLTCYLDALEAVRPDVQRGHRHAVAPVRRMARMLQTTSGMHGFPDVSHAASAVVEADEAQLADAVVALIDRLYRVIGEDEYERIRVLVAVHTPDLADMLGVTLDMPNRRILHASTAAEAAEQLARGPVALIVMELDLPDMDGRDLLVQLRQYGQVEQIPILVLTSENDPQTTTECFALGAESVFRAPIDIPAVSSAVSTRLRRRISINTRDRLTGLPARPVLQEAHQRLALVSDDTSCHCLALVEFDHFDAIHRTYGHVAGDRVLRQAVTAVQHSLREADLMVRWGNETCAVLLPNTTSAEAMTVLDRALYRLRNERFADEAGHAIAVSFTAGVGVLEEDVPLEEHVRRLRRPIEAAKERGGGRVVREHEERGAVQRRVLLLMEEGTMVEMLAHRFERAGLEVVHCPESEEALAKAQARAAALVVLSVALPGTDGFAVLQQLRRMPMQADTPIIMISPLRSEQHVVRALEEGAVDFMSSPISPAELVARARRWIDVFADG